MCMLPHAVSLKIPLLTEFSLNIWGLHIYNTFLSKYQSKLQYLRFFRNEWDKCQKCLLGECLDVSHFDTGNRLQNRVYQRHQHLTINYLGIWLANSLNSYSFWSVKLPVPTESIPPHVVETGTLWRVQQCSVLMHLQYPKSLKNHVGNKNGPYAAVNHRTIVTLYQHVSPSNNSALPIWHFKQFFTLMLQVDRAISCLT